MRLQYCNKWFRAEKEPIDLWDEQTARKAHEEKKPFTVIASVEEKPVGFLEVYYKHYYVGFLDEALREFVGYTFQPCEGKLFLTMAIHREYEGDSDSVIHCSSYFFESDGHLEVEDDDLLAKTASTRTGNVDVSSNWENFPEFGKYASIFRMERDISQTDHTEWDPAKRR